MEDNPATVNLERGSKQAGETRGRWWWVKPWIWSPRMLTALETGVKGGKWFSLWDKVSSERNLCSAFQQVAGNQGASGSDRVSIEMYERELMPNLRDLAEELRQGTYRPRAVRRVWIPKPGGKEQRPLGVPCVRDRVVQTVLCHVMEPIFERDFAEHSYGFRPGRGCKDALRRVDELLKVGYTHVVDADLKSYFDTIPHDQLMQRIQAKITDGKVLGLIEAFLKGGVLDGMREWTPETGSPQGSVLSPLLSNIYLDPLDHAMVAAGFEMVRYADDFVVMCRSEEEAQAALELVRQWVTQAGLLLHPTKTRIVDATTEGFDFLGYTFRRGRRRPRQKSLQKFKDTIRSKTKRTDGRSLSGIITDINRSAKGWFEYFKHAQKSTFPHLDSWIRMRLRSLLRSRRGLPGRETGGDRYRWPNAFFFEQGLFSMTQARARYCQSLAR